MQLIKPINCMKNMYLIKYIKVLYSHIHVHAGYILTQ